MKRLRDESESTDPQVRQAAQLIADVPALPRSEISAARVLRRMEGAPQSPVRARSRRVLAFSLVLGLAASAGAAFGVVELWGNTKDSDAAPSFEAKAPERPAGPTVSSPESQHAQAPPTPHNQRNEKDTTKSPPLSAASSPSALAEQPRVTPQKELRGPINGAKKKPNDGGLASEARLVQEAVEALRTSEDPERAEKLLAEYRKRASSSQLEEEALALSIEVALAKSDPRASSFAQQYLKKYPNGRFRSVALRARK